MTSKRFALIFCAAYLFLFTGVGAEEKAVAGTISIGKDLSYERGSSRAKEGVLEFPYRHAKAGKKKFWAYVVHHKNGSRLICKADEAQGKKDESGQLANQDFPADHPFQRKLDLIKHDAFVNQHKKLLEEKAPLDEEGWAVLSGGSAVHKIFYKNSEGRWFCFLGVREVGREGINGPILASFVRTRRGPEFATMNGSSWTPFQPLNSQTNAAALKVFAYLEKSKGF